MKKIKVGVVFGGRSGEHEVSIISASSVISSMDKKKYQITLIGITKEGCWKFLPFNGKGKNESSLAFLKKVLRNGEKCTPLLQSGKGCFLGITSGKKFSVDVLFPVLHGTYGEDGTIQGLFDMMNLPYVGCGVLGSSAGMDKDIMKHLFLANGLPVVKWVTAYQQEDIADIQKKVFKHLHLPVFVKPVNLGSSVGIAKVSKRSGLGNALRDAFRYDSKVIVEQGYDVREIECSVLGNYEIKASLPGEIIPKGDSFYSYKAKYQNTGSELLIPAPLNGSLTQKIRDYAVKAFQSVEGRGMARVDFFVTKKTGKIFVNELNTIPGFTSISMFPKLFAKSGLPYPRLLDKLFRLAMEVHKIKNSKKYSF